MSNTVIRFRIDFHENNNLGPGKIALLEAVQSTGSISDAARTLRMSYRRAWLLLNSLNCAFTEPVYISAIGGRGGGGVRITAFGARVITCYRSLEREIAQLGQDRLVELMPHVAAKRTTHPISVPRLAKKPLAKKI